ncbi:MAG: nitroreductase family protein, partial [Oceanisphaera sp.]|nr:nitroreductase family protein [Oceanisphaera sp.]
MPIPTIDIDNDKCRADNLCATVCPIGIIAPGGSKETPRPVAEMLDWCIGCGHCVAVCPTEALQHSAIAAEDCETLLVEKLPDADQVAVLLRSRRSIRRFKSEVPDRKLLEHAISMAGYAPSGHNGQPLNWIVFDRREDVRRIAEMTVQAMRAALEKEENPGRQMLYAGVVWAWDQGRDVILHDAPCLVVAHCRPRVGTEPIDTALALGTMDLAAVSLGLGCCWAGLFMAAAVKWPPI